MNRLDTLNAALEAVLYFQAIGKIDDPEKIRAIESAVALDIAPPTPLPGRGRWKTAGVESPPGTWPHFLAMLHTGLAKSWSKKQDQDAIRELKSAEDDKTQAIGKIDDRLRIYGYILKGTELAIRSAIKTEESILRRAQRSQVGTEPVRKEAVKRPIPKPAAKPAPKPAQKRPPLTPERLEDLFEDKLVQIGFEVGTDADPVWIVERATQWICDVIIGERDRHDRASIGGLLARLVYCWPHTVLVSDAQIAVSRAYSYAQRHPMGGAADRKTRFETRAAKAVMPVPSASPKKPSIIVHAPDTKRGKRDAPKLDLRAQLQDVASKLGLTTTVVGDA